MYGVRPSGRGTTTGGDSSRDSSPVRCINCFKRTLAFESAQRIGFVSQGRPRTGPPGRNQDMRGYLTARAPLSDTV